MDDDLSRALHLALATLLRANNRICTEAYDTIQKWMDEQDQA